MIFNSGTTRRASSTNLDDIQTFWSLIIAILGLIGAYRRNRKDNKPQHFYHGDKQKHPDRRDDARLWLLGPPGPT